MKNHYIKYITFFFLLLAANNLMAQTIRYVRVGGTGNGSSWTAASGNIQTMINASAANDQVWVAAGDYQPHYGSGYFLTEGVKVYGGFPATGNPVIADRNPATNVTRLIGNNYRVVTNEIEGLTNASVLDGFTITGGSGPMNGGGIYNKSCSPTYSNLIIIGNNAESNGAGVYNHGGSPVFVNVVITGSVMGLRNNYVNQKGSGFYTYFGNPVLRNVLITGNAITNNYGAGAGMYIFGGSPTLINVTIANNTVNQGTGAGIHMNYTTPVIRNSIIWNNGLYFEGSEINATYSNSIIAGSGGSSSWNASFGTNGGGNLDTNPLFTSASNFTLQSGSPAINTGNSAHFPNASTSKDLANNPRVFGLDIDMGAYEGQYFNPLDIGGLTTIAASPAYSLRKLSSAYTGKAISVRNSSGTVQDIGFLANGDLDTPALMAFVGSGSGFVTKWYDQSGLGFDAAQATTSLQPAIVQSGVLNTINKRPALYFGTSKLATVKATMFPNGVSMVGVAKGNSTVPSSMVTKTGTAAGQNLHYPAPFDFCNTNGELLIGNAVTPAAVAINLKNTTPRSDVSTTVPASVYAFTASPLAFRAYRNGVQTGVWLVGGYQDNGHSLMIGNRNDNTGSGNFYSPEMVLFNASLTTTERQALEASQVNYYFNADPNLSNLSTPAGSIPFSPETTVYTINTGLASTTVTPTAAQPMSVIELRSNGGSYATVTSGSPSAEIPLNMGSNLIEIRVTSQNGTVKLYSIDVNRKSTNADLSALTTSIGTLPFAVAATNYTITSPGTASMTINATPAVSVSTLQLQVNGGTPATLAPAAASAPIPLISGLNTIAVKVTAEDGVTFKTYTITVDTKPVLDLVGITTTSTQIPAYSLRKLRSTYTGPAIRVRRSNDNAQQDIGFTAQNELDVVALLSFTGSNNGFVTTWYDQGGSGFNATNGFGPRIVNGGVLEKFNGRPSLYFNINELSTPNGALYGSGASMHAIAQSVSGSSPNLVSKTAAGVFGGVNPAPFEFVTTSGSFRYGYVNGGSSGSSGMSVSIGTIPAIFGFAIANGSNGYAYRNGTVVGSSYVNTYGDSGNEMIIGNNFGNARFLMPELIMFKGILPAASRQALENSSMAYYFNNDAGISSLAAAAGTLSPAFSESVVSYTLSPVSSTATSVTFTASPTMSLATIKVRVNNGPFTAIQNGMPVSIALPDGNCAIEFVVTSQSQFVTKTYTVNIARASHNGDASAISLSAGSLNPQFDAAVSTYSVKTRQAQTTVTVVPGQNGASSSVSMNGSNYLPVGNGVASAPLSLNVGTNTLLVKVVSEDLLVTKVYTVNIARIVPNTLDTYNLTSSATSVPAYSLRRLSSQYSGAAVRVRRSSDNAQQDIGFTADGTLDTAALLSFAAAGNAFVVTWYDQSGFAYDATQSVTARQPVIVSAGTLTKLNGRAAVKFNVSDLGTLPTVMFPQGVSMLGVAGGTSGTPGTLASKTGTGSGANNNYPAPFDFTNSSGNFTVGRASSPLAVTGLDLNTTTPPATVSSNVLPSIYGFTIPVNGTVNSYRNGMNTGYAEISGYNDDGNALRIGNRNDNSGSGMLLTPELVLFDKVLTTEEKQSIENALRSFYFNTEASLSSLTTTGGILSPAFNSETIAYTLPAVSSGTASISFTMETTNPFASIELRVNDGAYSLINSASPATAILTAGDNTIDIRVTAQDGEHLAIYTITVRRMSSNANLGSFASSLNNWEYIADNTYLDSTYNTTFWFKAAASFPLSSLTYSHNGSPFVPIGNYVQSPTLALQAGINVIQIRITAEDPTVTKTYTFYVNRKVLNVLDLFGQVENTWGMPAYSMRRLSTGYTGPVMRIRRNDNMEQDIPFTSTGEFDAAAALAFAGNGDAYVVRWYDQSGYDYDAIQPVNSLQPTIVRSGVVDRMHGRPAIYMGQGKYFYNTSALYTNAVSMIGVAKGNSTTPSSLVTKTGNIMGNDMHFPAPFDFSNSSGLFSVGSPYLNTQGSVNLSNTTPRSDISQYTPGSIYGFSIAYSGLFSSYLNGTLVGSGNASGYHDGGSPLMIGNRNDLQGSANFWVAEMVLFNHEISQEKRQAAEATLNPYYFNNDASLSALNISTGILSPAFSGSTVSYTAAVNYNTASVSFTPVSNYSLATIEIRINGGAYTPVSSGAASIPLMLTTESSLVEVLVTAQNGNTTTYTITVNRHPDCSIQTVWNGTTWSNGAPVSAQYNAIIAGDYSSTGDLTACALTVSAGSVTVNSGHTFNIKNALVVEGGTLTFESGANLLQDPEAVTNSNSGNIIFKRIATMVRQDYVYWSAPVAGQNLQSFSPATLSNRFYSINEQTNAFVSVNPVTSSFAAATGYAVRAPNTFLNPPALPQPFTGTFVGVPNNGDIDIEVTVNGQGFNLIGNPYPSSLDADLFLAENPGTLYFWTHRNQTSGSGANYATFNTTGGIAASTGGIAPDGYVTAGQGFLFHTDAAATVHFSNSMRSAQPGLFYRQAPLERHRYWLNLDSAASGINQILVGYIEGATAGADASIDGELAEGGSSISSMIGNTNYVIQGRSLPFEVTDEVLLNVKIMTAGTYTIALDHSDGLFAEGQKIYLKDSSNSVIHDLTEGSYAFASEAGNFATRFSIVYQNSTLGVETPDSTASNIVAFKDQGILTVQSTVSNIRHIRVFDVRGRLLFEMHDINDRTVSLDAFTAQQQMLLLQVTDENGQVVVKKVMF